MDHFGYRAGILTCEAVSLARLAEAVGTPTYVYSEATLERHAAVLAEAFAGVPHLLCYSVKASPNLALLRRFARWGLGFDVVSGGELARVLHAGGSPDRTVFAGVGKTEDEMARALAAGILLFNVESAEELRVLDGVARRGGLRAPFALRVNPEVDARTHRGIATGLRGSKFGVPFREARELYRLARRMRGLVPRGLDCHIGSQLTAIEPVRAAVGRVAGLYRKLREDGLPLELLDLGGGLGIRYRDERPPSPVAWARALADGARATGARLIAEPGRVLVGNAGVLLTRVLYRKRTPAKTFVVVDAGMNDLLRPALYGAEHAILPVRRRPGRSVRVDVVGPVCESTDVLGKERRMVLPRRGDLLAIRTAGAYGMSMASTYNSRPRPAEVLVSGDAWRVVRTRERLEELWRGESAGR